MPPRSAAALLLCACSAASALLSCLLRRLFSPALLPLYPVSCKRRLRRFDRPLACTRSLWDLRSELCAALLTFRSLRSISFSSLLSPFLQTPLAPLRSLLLALADFRQAPLRALRISSRRTLRFVADFAKTPDLDLAAGYPVRPLSQIAVSPFEARSFRLRQTSASLRTARPVLRPSSLSATACLCFAKIRCPCLQNTLFASAAKVRSERSLRRTDISVRLSDRGSCLRPCERFSRRKGISDGKWQ